MFEIVIEVILVSYDAVLDEVVLYEIDDLALNDVIQTIMLDMNVARVDDELELDDSDVVGLADELEVYENVVVFLEAVSDMLDDDELEFIIYLVHQHLNENVDEVIEQLVRKPLLWPQNIEAEVDDELDAQAEILLVNNELLDVNE